MPRIEALAAVNGDRACTNEDLIRNSAYNWSPMAADDIREKTGIEQRLYTSRVLEEIAPCRPPRRRSRARAAGPRRSAR